MFSRILVLVSAQDDVRRDVAEKYWDNRWWPRQVRDWRLKILLAGLSTRVSYNAISTYQQVRDALLSRSFHDLASLSKAEFQAIVAPVGPETLSCRLVRCRVHVTSTSRV